jgi:hypothetical protein
MRPILIDLRHLSPLENRALANTQLLADKITDWDVRIDSKGCGVESNDAPGDSFTIIGYCV